MPLQQATMEKEFAESLTTRIRMETSNRYDKDRISEWEHKYLQYTEGGPGKRSHKPWRMGEINIRSPTMDQVMMDTTQAAAKMIEQMCEGSATRHEDGPPSDALSNQEELMMFQFET